MFVWANEQTAVRESLSHHLCAAYLPVSLCVSEFDCAAEEKRVQDLKVTVKIKAALLSLIYFSVPSSRVNALRSNRLFWWFVVNQHPINTLCFCNREFTSSLGKL